VEHTEDRYFEIATSDRLLSILIHTFLKRREILSCIDTPLAARVSSKTVLADLPPSIPPLDFLSRSTEMMSRPMGAGSGKRAMKRKRLYESLHTSITPFSSITDTEGTTYDLVIDIPSDESTDPWHGLAMDDDDQPSSSPPLSAVPRPVSRPHPRKSLTADEYARRLQAYKKYIAYYAMSRQTAGLIFRFIDLDKTGDTQAQGFPCQCGRWVQDSSTSTFLRHFSSWDGCHARFVIGTMDASTILTGIPAVLPSPPVQSGSIKVVEVVQRSEQWLDDLLLEIDSSPDGPTLASSSTLTSAAPLPPAAEPLTPTLLTKLRRRSLEWRQAAVRKPHQVAPTFACLPDVQAPSADDTLNAGWPTLPGSMDLLSQEWLAAQAAFWGVAHIPTMDLYPLRPLQPFDGISDTGRFRPVAERVEWLEPTPELLYFLRIRSRIRLLTVSFPASQFLYRLCVPCNNCILDSLLSLSPLLKFKAFRGPQGAEMVRRTIALLYLAEWNTLQPLREHYTGRALEPSLVLTRGSVLPSQAMDESTWLDESFFPSLVAKMEKFELLP